MQRFLPVILLFAVLFFATCKPAQKNQQPAGRFFTADNPAIQYTGRVDFSNPKLPRFWAPGVYITAHFKGPACSFVINDEVLWGNSHNYIEVVVDDRKPVRLQLKGKTDTIQAATGLSKGEHSVLICKNTESGIGYLEFAGFQCSELLIPPAKPVHKIEFIGNSITCGAGMDLSEIPCNTGKWYDQHNAYMSYGAVTARTLKAQWQLSSVSGIGLIHSCCNMKITMPQVFDKLYMHADSLAWNFTQYKPDVVTVCLGQNDGIQDSATFTQAYITFLGQLRGHYPAANIICLTSPMGDAKLTAVLKNYIDGVVDFINKRGDKKVSRYFFSKQYHAGCGGHPDMEEHQQIAGELTAYIKKTMNW